MLLLVGGALWVVYGRAVNAPLIFDDATSVEHNASITRLWPLVGDAEHPGPLNPTPATPTAGRPLVNLSLALNYHFGRLNPFGYHVFNVFVHVLSTWLVWAIVGRTLRLAYFGDFGELSRAGRFDRGAGPLSLAVALLWALHPLQTEAVIYVTQRTELMVAFFYLATLYCSLRYWSAASPPSRRAWLAIAVLACAAGMASKEVMVSAPLVVLLFERTFIAGSLRQAWRQSWPLYAGLMGTWALLLWLNYNGPRSNVAGFHLEVPAYVWWFTQAKVFLMYLKLVCWPSPLAIHYEIPYLDTLGAAWPWLLGAAFVVIGTAILLWRNHPVGFLGACVLIILSPTSIVPVVTEAAAERRMYLPLAALVTLVVVGAYWLANKGGRGEAEGEMPGPQGYGDHRPSPGIVVAGGALVLALVCGLVSVRRLDVYGDELKLWQDTVASQPLDPMAHNNLGAELAARGRLQEAIESYQEAVRLKPDYAVAHNNLGVSLANANRLQEAVEHFELALEERPDDVEIRNNLGNALAAVGRLSDASEQFERASESRPDDATVPYNRATALLRSGRAAEAIAFYRQALELRPDYAEAHNNLAVALSNTGKPQEAIGHFQQAVRLNPDYAEAHNNLGALLSDTGRGSEAITHFEQALRLIPDYADARNNLAESLSEAGRFREAIGHYERALQFDPENLQVYARLAEAYAAVNRSADAIAVTERAVQVARSTGQTALAQQIEAWLAEYRASLSGEP